MAKNLIDLTKNDYLEITKLAALAFTPREVALMLEVDTNQFVCACDIEDLPVYSAYHSGYLQAQVDLRTAIMKLAKSGSSPAQMMAIDILNKSKQKILDR